MVNINKIVFCNMHQSNVNRTHALVTVTITIEYVCHKLYGIASLPLFLEKCVIMMILILEQTFLDNTVIEKPYTLW